MSKCTTILGLKTFFKSWQIGQFFPKNREIGNLQRAPGEAFMPPGSVTVDNH